MRENSKVVEMGEEGREEEEKVDEWINENTEESLKKERKERMH